MTESVEGKTAPKLGIMIEVIENGITVIDVMKDSPAAKIGLQPDDLITALNEQTIETMFDLKYSLFYLEEGETVPITILRDGKEIVQDITF
jgi:S1-C subfamily serine protease